MYTDKPTFTHIQPSEDGKFGDSDNDDSFAIDCKDSDAGNCNDTAKPKCVAYYRVSTDKQGRSGLGLEAQRQAVAEFIRSRGWLIEKEFTEVESGKKNDRPCMAEAIKEAKRIKGKLVIAKLDRLARNVHFISGLMETKVDFVAVDMPNADKFMLHIFAAMAEEEGRRISQRTKAALAAAKARGVKLGANGKVLAEQNKQAAHVFALTLAPAIGDIRNEGYRSVRQITGELNRRGIPSRDNGRWHLRSTALLLNRLYEKLER